MTPKITHRKMTPEELLADGSNYATAIYQDGALRTMYMFESSSTAEDMAVSAIKDREWWHDASSWTASVVTIVQDHGIGVPEGAFDAADLDSIVDRAYIDHIGNGGIMDEDEDPRDAELREYREFIDALNGWISRGMCDADDGGIYNEGTEMLQQVYGFLNGYAAASQHICI